MWNSMTSTSFVFTELANTKKYGGVFLYNRVFIEWRHYVSQNEVWGRGCYITLFSPSDVTAFHRIVWIACLCYCQLCYDLFLGLWIIVEAQSVIYDAGINSLSCLCWCAYHVISVTICIWDCVYNSRPNKIDLYYLSFDLCYLWCRNSLNL